MCTSPWHFPCRIFCKKREKFKSTIDTNSHFFSGLSCRACSSSGFLTFDFWHAVPITAFRDVKITTEIYSVSLLLSSPSRFKLHFLLSFSGKSAMGHRSKEDDESEVALHKNPLRYVTRPKQDNSLLSFFASNHKKVHPSLSLAFKSFFHYLTNLEAIWQHLVDHIRKHT